MSDNSDNTSAGNDLIGKFACLTLLFGVAAQIIAYLFFLEQGIKFSGIDFEKEELMFGWVLQGLAFLCTVLTLFLALKLED